MKKSLFALLMMATFALTFTACKKDKDEDKTPSTTENTWTVGETKYELASSLFKPKFDGNKLTALSDKGAISIEFKAKPAANGTFTIKSLGSELGDTDCTVTNVSETQTAFSTGKTGDVAKITVSGGKVRVEMSKIEVEILKDGASTKTSLSANILEN